MDIEYNTKELHSFQALVEASDRYVCVIEKATKKFLYANSQFFDFLGETPEKARGKHCYEVLCHSMDMKTNDNCMCYSAINSAEPVETYNPAKEMHLSIAGREVMWSGVEAYAFYLTDITSEKRKDELLEDSIKRFNVALDNSDLMIWEYDMVNHRCINSEKAGRDYAVPLVIENYPESLFTTGYTPPETIEQIKDVKRRLFNGESGFSVERRTVDQFGKSNWQKVEYTLECDQNGKPIRAIVCGLDITAQKELEQKYDEQLEYRNNLAKKAMVSVQLDLTDNVVVDFTCLEPVLQPLLEASHTATEFLDNFFSTSVFNPDGEITKEKLQMGALKDNYILGQRQYQTMYQCSFLNKYLELNLAMHKNPENKHLEAFIIVLDVSNNAFLYDPLTGLYNRQKTYLECNRVLQEHPDDPMVMVHFDIQRFRLYNSFFGESEGDRLLKYIADMFRRLSNTYNYGVYGRIEADVFLLLFPYRNNVIEWNEKFIQECLAGYRNDFQITGYSGICMVRDRTLSVDALFNRATIAAKNTTEKQLRSYCIFDDTMEKKLIQEQEILRDMRKAIDEEQFQVYLQPKYKLVTGEPFGAEALVRWIHPEKGMISPAAFIQLFEMNGFITTLDQYMWEHVCRLLRKWLDDGKSPEPVSVNMSRVSMYSPQTVAFLTNLIEKYQIPPRLLNLELTESAYMDDPDAMKKRLDELRSYGCEIMMDDFGSGYSSLNTLREIPVDYMKVDRMFLASVDHDDRSRMVLEAVIHMATKMGIPVITEGVETELQKEFLKSIGCDYVQGYLYAKPMSTEEYEKIYIYAE